MANITEFKSRLSGGGVRPNQFKVRLTFPDIATAGAGASGVNLMDDLSFLCEATTLPGQTIGKTSVKFRGRELKLAGDSRTFEDWGIDVLMDTDFKLYDAFTNWMNAINNLADNTGVINTELYQATGDVIQMDRDGEPLKTIKFIGMFPIKINDIELDYKSENQIETFHVDFSYQWYETDINADFDSYRNEEG